MPETVRNAVFGNVGSIISFRVGPFDAELLEKIFAPTFTKEDLVNLGFAQIYLTLMIDGVGSPPFSAVTIPPIVALDESNRKAIVDYARKTYAKPRDQVQKEITGWYGEEVGNSSNKKQEGPKAGESKKKDDGQQSFKPFVQVKPPNVGKNVIPKINNNNNVPRKFSLDILRHKPQASGHKEDLKSVLKEILADKKNKKEEPPKKSTEVKKEELGKKETVQKLTAPVEKKQEEKSEKTPMTKNEAEKQEIPQNVLEDILRVDLE